MRFRAITSVVNRYYDPAAAQFLSVDPLVAQTGQPYVFTNDNPLNMEDPLGLAELGIGNGANEFEVPDGYSNSAPDPKVGGNAGDETKSEGRGPAKIGNPKTFNPESLKGETSQEIKSRIPSNWTEKPSNSGGGTIYQDPENGGRQIRVMPGYGEGVRDDPLKAGPYAVISQNGIKTYVPLAGNTLLK